MDTSKSTSPSLLDRIRDRRLTATFTILATLSLGILVGSVITSNVSGKEQAVDSSDAKPIVIPNPVTLSNGFSQIVKEVSPAVVNINTEELPKQSATRRGRGGDDNPQTPGDMQDFFNRFFGGQGGGQGDDDSDGGSSSERRALGSGFIVDPRGYIITNNHVVDGADKIYVKLSTDPEADDGDNGRPATVIGVDKDTDIAVIKIDAKQPLPTIKLGNSDGAQVGDWVLAIGSPFALSKTVTAGIISAKNRQIDEPGPDGVSQSQFQHFIQTDAAINPGNSGGPLVNLRGEVIGINTRGVSEGNNLGFAIPIDTAKAARSDFAKYGKVLRRTRGIVGVPRGPDIAIQMGLPASYGVLVERAVPGGPAERSGIHGGTQKAYLGNTPIFIGGDLLVAINGDQVRTDQDIAEIMDGHQAGETVTLTIYRGQKRMDIKVVLGNAGDSANVQV